MKSATSHTKDITIPLLLVVAGIVLTGLSPNLETVEKIMLSYLKHKSLVWVVKASVASIVCLLPYWIYQRVIIHNPPKISPKKQDELLELIKDSCDSKFNLRNTYRNDKIDSLLGACASRGFTVPEGSVYGGVLNLYINELRLFSDTVIDAIMEALNSERFIVPIQPLVSLSKDIIWNKSKELGVLYYQFIDKYPHPMKKQQQLSAFAAFDKEATLLIAKVAAQIKLKGEV